MTDLRAAHLSRQLWYGQSAWSALLLPLAWLYGGLVRARRLAYRRGWLGSGHPGVPVIVVGNLVAGGTGKTPLVAWLVKRLQAMGRRPGIVSRGYGGRPQTRPRRVGADSLARDLGDEPLLLARRTGAPVAVCIDRLRAARDLAADGADVIVADDGLQHYALRRDLEIAVIDGDRRLGNGRLLPAGPLREPASRLGVVDLVLVNGTRSDAEPGFRLRLTEAVALMGGERRPLAAFRGCKVLAVAGIGNPARFHSALAEAGVDVVPIDVADHGVIDLRRLRNERALPILMTEKDAVKYPHCQEPAVWFLPADVDMDASTEMELMKRVGRLLRAGEAPAGLPA